MRHRLERRLVRTDAGCLEWQGYRMPAGYGQIGLPRRGAIVTTHRLAYELAYGAVPEGLFVCHRCDNPPCCDPEHLFAGTSEDNVRDMDSKARRITLRGEDRPSTRLPASAVADIRRRYIARSHPARKTGGSTTELAREYGISPQYVREIVKGRWRAHEPQP